MDQISLSLLLFVALLIGFGIYMRGKYGNLYLRFSEVVERRTGITMATVVRGLGLLTLVVWAAVFLTYGGDKEEGLEAIFQDFLPDRKPAPEKP